MKTTKEYISEQMAKHEAKAKGIKVPRKLKKQLKAMAQIHAELMSEVMGGTVEDHAINYKFMLDSFRSAS
jgi:hypothetical protein